MKRILSVALAILLTFSSVGCTNEKKAEDNFALNAKIGTWKTAQTIQPFFYQYFLGSSDKAEILPFTNPGDMKTALLAGSLDMCGTTIVTAITAASKGEPVKIVCGLSNKCSALVVGKDSDINTVADLKGKKIAYVPGTMHHLLLLETLNKNGIDPQKDVELQRIDFFDMGQALAQGNIDAFYSGEPYPSIVVAEGFGRILAYPDEDGEFGIINSGMMTTVDHIKQNPELIQALVTAHAKATEFLNSDRNAWIEKSAEFGTAKDVLDVSLNNIELFWAIDENYIASIRSLAERMKEQGLITEVPDIDALFDLSFVNQTKKELQNENN